MAQRIKRLIQTGEFVPMKQENLEPVIHGEIFVLKIFINFFHFFFNLVEIISRIYLTQTYF